MLLGGSCEGLKSPKKVLRIRDIKKKRPDRPIEGLFLAGEEPHQRQSCIVLDPGLLETDVLLPPPLSTNSREFTRERRDRLLDPQRT